MVSVKPHNLGCKLIVTGRPKAGVGKNVWLKVCRVSSADLNSQHRNRTTIKTRNREGNFFTFATQRQHIEQRQVIGSWAGSKRLPKDSY